MALWALACRRRRLDPVESDSAAERDDRAATGTAGLDAAAASTAPGQASEPGGVCPAGELDRSVMALAVGFARLALRAVVARVLAGQGPFTPGVAGEGFGPAVA